MNNKYIFFSISLLSGCASSFNNEDFLIKKSDYYDQCFITQNNSDVKKPKTSDPKKLAHEVCNFIADFCQLMPLDDGCLKLERAHKIERKAAKSSQ